MLNSVLSTEIWFGSMRPVYTYPLLYLLRNLQACVFPRKMHRALRRSKTSGPAALNGFTLWRPYAAKRGEYDRTKHAFLRYAFTYASRVQYELHIAFVSRSCRVFYSRTYGPSFPVGQCKIRYFLRVEFFLSHSVHTFLQRCSGDVAHDVNSISIRFFNVHIRIVSIMLTVRFRFGKSGRRKRKWRVEKEVTEVVRYKHKYSDL